MAAYSLPYPTANSQAYTVELIQKGLTLFVTESIPFTAQKSSFVRAKKCAHFGYGNACISVLECARKLCASLFRHEVTSPTRFHAEFKEAFGRPVYEGLKNLLAMKVKDVEQLDLWTSSIWAQVSVYALADSKWHGDFRPEGLDNRAWAEKVRDHICEQVFAAIG